MKGNYIRYTIDIKDVGDKNFSNAGWKYSTVEAARKDGRFFTKRGGDYRVLRVETITTIVED